MFKADGKTVLDKCGKQICPHCNRPTYDAPVSIQIATKGWGVASLQSLAPAMEHDTHLANARLIAAAPELLAALIELQTQIHAHHKMQVKKDFSLMVADAQASKAIVKATGE
jgi:hypothetical protein